MLSITCGFVLMTNQRNTRSGQKTENHAEEDEEFTSAMQRAMNAMSPKEEVVVPLEGGKAH